MRCSACGQELSVGAGTCPRCGQLVLTPMPAPPEAMPGVAHMAWPHMPVGRLGPATSVVLATTAVALLVRSFSFDQATANGLSYLTSGLILVSAILVVVWF